MNLRGNFETSCLCVFFFDFDLLGWSYWSSQDACPVLFRLCPIILRVRSMLYVKEANGLLAQYDEESKHLFSHLVIGNHSPVVQDHTLPNG
jgi:hypothetical protein